jgi:2-succinyl-5-enolpyruvyl-6-hydroxy-3-cyclohexene-1-carboxylate synthase
VDRRDEGLVSAGDVALACAAAFVRSLESFGLRDACLSPGSRSTPLALALARNDRIRVHVHLDERSSGFFALGLAKASDRPVAVVSTSGTAAANLLPAMVEASMSCVPVIALTADRPPELRGVGANQTIDQRELFGRFARWHVEAPVPSVGPDAVNTWTLLGAEVYSHACSPGPVHVNLPFREPLVPAGDRVDLGTMMTAFGGVALGRGRLAEPAEVDALVGAVGGVERGLVVLGGLRTPAPAAIDLADRLGWPVLAEPTSGSRVPGTLRAGQFLLADEGFLGANAPEIVLQVGAAPTSRPGLALAAAVPRLLIVDPDDLVADPARHAERRFAVAADHLARAAADRLEPLAGAAWLDIWREADERARRAVDTTIEEWDEPYEGRLARDLAASLPGGATLVVGSSMPVRDLDAYMLPREGLRVLANRGASGIDGFVSTTLGIAASGAPTVALCGDLTLLHDVGAVLWSRRAGHEATFVVPNNGGGVIFSFLSQRDLPELRELFTTPHGLDLRAICDAAGAGHRRVERAGDLVPAVESVRATGGVQVVEVAVDAQANVRRHAVVHAAVATALGRA